MRKIVAFLLATTILLSMCISVSAVESDPQPRYINTNQAKIVMGISDTGLASITITLPVTGTDTVSILSFAFLSIINTIDSVISILMAVINILFLFIKNTSLYII